MASSGSTTSVAHALQQLADPLALHAATVSEVAPGRAARTRVAGVCAETVGRVNGGQGSGRNGASWAKTRSALGSPPSPRSSVVVTTRSRRLARRRLQGASGVPAHEHGDRERDARTQVVGDRRHRAGHDDVSDLAQAPTCAPSSRRRRGDRTRRPAPRPRGATPPDPKHCPPPRRRCPCRRPRSPRSPPSGARRPGSRGPTARRSSRPPHSAHRWASSRGRDWSLRAASDIRSAGSGRGRTPGVHRRGW